MHVMGSKAIKNTINSTINKGKNTKGTHYEKKIRDTIRDRSYTN